MTVGPDVEPPSPEEEPDRIKALMEYVMAAIVSTYATAEVTLPARQTFTFGTPVHDCEQVTVSFVQAYLGMPGNQGDIAVRCNGPRAIVLSVQIVRCVPVPDAKGRPPTADAIEASAFELTRDAWMLLLAVGDMDPWGTGVIADVTAPDPSGGFGGPVLNLTVNAP